jgi:hypothetical protein
MATKAQRAADEINKTNRRMAADAILRGFADTNVATVLSTARTAGFVFVQRAGTE